ncbi:hypothetical protein M0804_002213 [Polistes exclamans]|nr:hypothetical protein M0804_002213 [Polistes exclamans]
MEGKRNRGLIPTTNMFYNVLFCYIFLLYGTKNVTTHRLNVPRVLLPVFNDFAVNFTLEVTDGGCYQWSTSRLDIIQLIPISENFDKSCSSSIMIQTITRESTRNTAIVLAEDVNTGQLLRCDVIIDAIFSLNLVTTTRELYIEEAPEAFEVRAYDEQGNEFTTLAGIEFLWSIGHLDKRTQSDNKILGDVLRFLTYQESQYETPSTVAELDAAGKQGHIVLLEGIRTGTAKVSVKLPYLEYRHVLPIEVELIVIANLIIIPSEVTMMQFDNFKYKIMQIHQGRLETINLPSSQYYLEAENPDMLDIDNDISNAYALSMGRTKVFLHDKNVRDEYPVILPSAVVNVNSVAYISLAVLPNRNWGLILGQTHEIVVELYDNKDHKFHIGEGVKVSIKVDNNYFDTKFVSQNGTYLVGVPITCGTMLVKATLYGIMDKNGKEILLTSPLSAEVELVIHTLVTVRPRVLAVLWDSRSKSRYDIVLKASGGDGSYTWTSRNSSVVTVSQNGGIRILAPGSSEIIVAMSRNQYNKDTAKIHVLLPSKLKIIEYSIEAAVGEPIHLHIALYGKLTNGSDSKEIPFNDCKDINFEMIIPDGNFVQNSSKDVQPIGVSCTVITIISSSIGISQVTIAYNASGKYLMDNITVSAYEPLTVVHPKNKETLLAVGSSRKIVFKGGPHPWSGKSQSYSRRMISSNENIAEVTEHMHSLSISYDISVFEVLCKALGEVTLTYTVSNVPLLPNCKTTYAKQTTQVTCGKPRYIYLQPEVKDSNSCPLKKNPDKILAHSDKSQKFTIIVKDEDGRQFDNITSLNIEWNIKPPAAGHMEISTASIEETFTDMQVVLPKRHYQNVVFTKRFGKFTICAIIIGYQKHILGKLRITPEWPAFPVQNDKGNIETPIIENCIEITLVNDTILNPNRLIILNDPNGKYYLEVTQGSGYYEFILSSNDVADVRYMEPTKVISVKPKKAGIVHISLRDLCLPSKEAEAIIEVQQLAVIETDVINKIEKGKCVIAALKLLDTNGNIIKLPSLDILNFKPKFENKYIEIKQLSLNEHGNPPYDQVLYKVYGVDEGETQLIFISEANELVIQSEPVSIQVFLPLKIHPKNLTILIGTIYQIQAIGGPTNAEIEFSTKNNEILSIDHNGVFEGKSNGQTKIIARAIGLNAKGNKIVYSEDYTTIHVLYLEGVKIVTPITRVKIGGTFPLWAFGIPEYLTPLIIGSMQLPLSFSWSSSDSNFLSLHNMYEGTGINIRYQNEVSIRARALEAGSVTVYLNVTVPSSKLSGLRNEVTYTTSVKIEIFEELRLIYPPLPSGSSVILMAPNSMLKLQTNWDKHGSITYQIISSTQQNNSKDPNALNLLSKSVTIHNGVIKSGDQFGRTIISITNVEMYNVKQVLTIVVDVKPIHYMMLSLHSKLRIRSGEELNMLPKGMELDYIVEYYDNVGIKFHAAETNIKTTLNRVDLATFIINPGNLITTKFIENGELVVKVFNDKYHQGMFDYVYMRLGDIVFPTKATLTIGDIVCFSMPLLSSDGDPGYWQSTAPEILLIDPITGIARARNVGHAVIKHSLATHMQGEIEVTVQAISKVSIVPIRGRNITGFETFSVPLVLKSKDEQIKENNVLSRGLGGCRTSSSFTLTTFPYTCNIQLIPSSSIGVKDMFLVKPRFSIATGFYYCDIIPMDSPSVPLSTLETRIQISARCRDFEATPLELTYLPPIYISTKEILFVNPQSQTVPFATVEIFGLQSVLEHVTIEVPDGITISGRSVFKSWTQIRLRLMNNQDDIQGQKVIVSNELTKQNISLFIRISKYDHFMPFSGIQWVDYIYFHRYTFGTFAVIVITCFYIWKNRVTNVDLTIKNRSVFVDKCPPTVRKTSTPYSPTMNTSNMSSPHSPTSPLRPFSAFEPVYGDPRGLFTPLARRNRTLN